MYRAMCSVNEKLFVSYPEKTGDGKSIAPSSMIADIIRVLPNVKIDNGFDNSFLYLSTPEATIHRLLIQKSAVNENDNPLWEAVYEWYAKNEGYADKIALLKRAKWFLKENTVLDKELAQKLYEQNTTYNASRLNVFAKCPFGYFMQYGLRLSEREEWEIKPTDVGIYAHELIKSFCETVEKDAHTDEEKLNAWRKLSDTRRDEILDSLIDTTCTNMQNHSGYDSEKNTSILRRTGKNIKNAAKTVHMSLSRGAYVEKGLEKRFNISITPDIDIVGTIDRLDMYKGDNDERVRIVDYKTGGTEFDVVNIVNGVDMQMVIYAIAAREMAREFGLAPRVSGIYYNKVHNKFVSSTMGDTMDVPLEKRDDNLRLDGITFIKSDDDFLAEDADIPAGNNSGFLNIGYDKRGNLSRKCVHTAYEIEGLMETVKENIIDMDRQIKDGYIKCNPYETKSSSACKYCSFGEVCMFCNDKVSRYVSGKADDVWSEMGIKGGDDTDGN